MLQKKEKKDSDSCTRVFEKYYRELAYFAFRILKDRDAGEDVVQDMFVMLFEKGLPEGDGEALKSYLYVTVRNRCLDYLKHLKVVEKYQVENAEGETFEESILASLIETEVLSILKREIDALPKECAKVMRLLLVGYNSVEVAQELHVEPSTVRAQKQRGLMLLKKTLPRNIFLFFFKRIL